MVVVILLLCITLCNHKHHDACCIDMGKMLCNFLGVSGEGSHLVDLWNSVDLCPAFSVLLNVY